MKERYFTPQSIDNKSQEMLRTVERLRNRHQLTLSPPKSALLVLDMQRYFLEESSHAHVPSADSIVQKVADLVGVFAQQRLPVVFTRHLNSDSDAGMMSVWWRDLVEKGNPTSEIIAELDLSQGTVINKNQYDAFHETDLEEMLRRRGVGQLVICGVMTHLCCETTARSAFMRGFEVFFTIDGTATYNQEFHRATLLNLAHGFAVPVLIDEIILALGKTNEG